MDDIELVIEILEDEQDWGRLSHLQHARDAGREIRFLSLLEANSQKTIPPEFCLDVHKHAERAAALLRQTYPVFLNQLANTTQLFDVKTLGGKVSLYWFMPISEMSFLRNPVQDKIYALYVLREALQESPYKKATLILDDPLLEAPARQIAAQLGVRAIEVRRVAPNSARRRYRSRAFYALKWGKHFLDDILLWIIFRVFNVGRTVKQTLGVSQTLGLTIFPTLWAKNNQGILENRAFGDLPAENQRRGRDLAYLAIPIVKPRSMIGNFKYWRETAQENNILFVQSLISFTELLSAYLRLGWGVSVEKWFAKLKDAPLQLDGFNVMPLMEREFLREIWEPTIPQSVLLALAATRATKKINAVAYAVFAFEFQPIERAFVVGVKLANPQIPLVGIQTSLIGESHLGYLFSLEQARAINKIQPPFAPLPDYVATYGDIANANLTKRLGKERVFQTGPIRYPYLKIDSDEDRQQAALLWKKRLNLPPDAVLAILALPSIKEEALSIMQWTIKAAKKYPQLFLLVRFHYWAVLTDELQTLSRANSFERFQIVSGDLHDLLLASQFMITGSSSVGIEAMVSGCMPISYQTHRRYSLNPTQDVREGAFFFVNEFELTDAMRECLLQSDVFFNKKTLWGDMIKRFCNPLDGNASSRLYEWLDERGAYNAPDGKAGSITRSK